MGERLLKTGGERLKRSDGKSETKKRSEKQNISHFHVSVLDNPSKWQNMIHSPCDSYCRSSLMVPNEQFSGNTIVSPTNHSSDRWKHMCLKRGKKIHNDCRNTGVFVIAVPVISEH